MIRFYRWLLFAGMMIMLSACSGEVDTEAKALHWDREICERCKMLISVREFAAQTINPHNGKRYYWDDIGCAVLWFDEENIAWEDEAITYIIDVQTLEWIDAKKAFYTHGAITPMDFGFSAHKNPQAGEENYDYAYVRDRILGKPL